MGQLRKTASLTLWSRARATLFGNHQISIAVMRRPLQLLDLALRRFLVGERAVFSQAVPLYPTTWRWWQPLCNPPDIFRVRHAVDSTIRADRQSAIQFVCKSASYTRY
jgi:hypothetical protein